MSCEGRDIHEIPMKELHEVEGEYYRRYLRANANVENEPIALSQARAIVELKQTRLLLAEIGARDPESYRHE